MRAGLLAIMLAVATLSACSRETVVRCSRDTAYLEARNAGQLRIPDDLSIPDEVEALRIPGSAGGPDEPEEPATECLDQSPAFIGAE